VRAQAAPPARPVASSQESRILYGDSTPFPYDIDFIALLRAVVDGCAKMLAAQSMVDDAVDRLARFEEQIVAEKVRLQTLMSTIEQATGSFASALPRIKASSGEVLKAAGVIVGRELGELDKERGVESAACNRSLDDACTHAYQALEAFLLAHVPPQSRLAWQLTCDESGYDGVIHVSTAFGLAAHFSASIPDQHMFGRPRRVADLAPDTVVMLPRPGRRVSELRPVRLDKLYIARAVLDPDSIAIVVARGHGVAGGWRFEISGEGDETCAQLLDERGQPTLGVDELDEQSRQAVLRLAAAVLDGSMDLPLRRQLMLDAQLDGETLRSRHEPREVVLRLVTQLAPIVREIDRRSGAPGELLLRHTLDGGRREAVFVTKAELWQKLQPLPPNLRKLFAPFGLVK
jgi:hypothetical protein